MKEILHTAGAVGTIAVGEVADYVADYLDQVEGHEEPVLSHEVVKEPEVGNVVPKEVNQQETVSDVKPVVESAPAMESAPSVVNEVASAQSSEVVVPEGVSNENVSNETETVSNEATSNENETASNSNSNSIETATTAPESETPSIPSSTDATAASPEAVSPATQTNEEAPKESAPAEETTPKSNFAVC